MIRKDRVKINRCQVKEMENKNRVDMDKDRGRIGLNMQGGVDQGVWGGCLIHRCKKLVRGFGLTIMVSKEMQAYLYLNPIKTCIGMMKPLRELEVRGDLTIYNVGEWIWRYSQECRYRSSKGY